MLAPCVITSESETNPYYSGETNAKCTCPLVEVTTDYNVPGGLQDPCSDSPTRPGDYVQAAGDALLEKIAGDPILRQAAWGAVKGSFIGNDYSGGSVGGASALGDGDMAHTSTEKDSGAGKYSLSYVGLATAAAASSLSWWSMQ